jgi:hypothetical protein
MTARLLKPLGIPPSGSVNFIAILELVKDRAWLARVTNALNHRCQRNNTAKRDGACLQPLLVALPEAV